MNALTRTLAVLLPVAMLWGCTTTPSTTDAGAAGGGDAGMSTGMDSGSAVGADMGSGVEVGGIDAGGAFSGDPLRDPDSLLSKRVVYFDFDKSDIKPDTRQIIEAHAQYLSEHPDVHIVLEGHCDERGTREYNLGLGERRSKSVQQVMSLLGVSGSQLELVSYGEERPAAMGHDESAWGLNRRVEFIY